MPQPRWIGGYSFGGIVAFEMARQLAQRGTPPQRVIIIDAPAPLERAHHTSLVQYGAYLAYSPAPSPGQKLPLAIIRATTPRHSDLSDIENRQLAIPDMGWQLFTDAAIPVLHITGDHVTMLGPVTASNVAAAIASLLHVTAAPDAP
ncbi:MAG: hypothetical protein B7X10_01610 [Burkholderiales bacterium 21-58-4]|nr:MAG: hypothetical protein B7X10_01610 [Burkholderiales bacterium 21-58-4]